MTCIVVTGGRQYMNRAKLWGELDALHARDAIRLLVEGGATGADTLAREWADERGVLCHTVHAEWKRFGKFAGPRRNSEMLDRYQPALVVAFPGGQGTADCVRQARFRNIAVMEVPE